MYRVIMIATALLWASAFVPCQSPAEQAISDQVRELLRNRIEAAGVPPKITVGEEIIHARVMLPLFYERRAYLPAWIADYGLKPGADVLIKAIREADREGLRPSDYHLAKIEATLKEVRQNQEKKNPINAHRLVDLDLLFTDVFLLYGSHLLAGKINPETIDAEWHANRREVDLAMVLQVALDTNKIAETLKSLLPPQPGYTRLREALARYRGLVSKGGWPAVPDGPKMQKGDCGERVAALRTRLITEGDPGPIKEGQRDLFDDALEQAVRRFQQRQGLEDDGIVGVSTLAALNIPAEARLHQIELNLERWRWLPQDIERCYILVNIADFKLAVIENDKSVMTMRAVVGKPYRRTPTFSAKITYLVLSPFWHVPSKIAVQDKLPRIRKDPEYLAKQNIKVFQGWDAQTREIDPTTIDWSKVTAKNFNYRFRQEPGPTNALGRVKFMFPNKFDVYLHDTPSRELFTKIARVFSSGCIRIEKPIELAEYVLRADPKWPLENILAAMDKHVEQTVRLPEPITIHLVYWTAWVDADGSIQFRNDIYARDNILAAALSKAPAHLWSVHRLRHYSSSALFQPNKFSILDRFYAR